MKELLSQLNNLKSVKPDNQWKKESRDILLAQISGGDYAEERNVKINTLYYLRTFFHQPVLVVTTILLIVLGGGIFSVGAARDSKPGDSLYIAKIISEKAQLAITFDEKEKAKLGIEFAGNRAKEIAQVLAEEGNGNKEEKVEKLARDFKKEITAAKTRLKKINMIKEDAGDGDNDAGNIITSEDIDTQNTEEDNVQMFSANLGREDKGVQIYDPNSEAARKDMADAAGVLSSSSTSSTTVKNPISNGKNVEQILEEAEKLFAQEDYDGTLNKLEEINSIIDRIDDTDHSGSEVKGESGNATTTEEVEVLGVGEEAGVLPSEAPADGPEEGSATTTEE
jgi:hypothetical protein